MKLSVLIPVYNCSIQSLLEKLSNEIAANGLQNDLEILVVDDASPQVEIKQLNQNSAAKYPWIQYLELERNLGRSGIRNLLIDRAKGRSLLFLDCDVLPDRHSFLDSYLQHSTLGRSVIVGGLSYSQVGNVPETCSFYFRFSNKTDVHPASVRSQNPWKYVLTSNLVIPTDIARKFRFDEDYVGHGYEDLEWASRINQNGVLIEHIDNPVSHLGLVEDSVFFQRMRQSMGNLQRFSLEHPSYFEQTQVARFSKRLRWLPKIWLELLDGILSLLFSQKNLPFFPRFVGFQLDKTILFEIQCRTSISRAQQTS